jgi:arginine deiminase
MTVTTAHFGAQSMVAPLKRVLLKHARDAFSDPERIAREWRPLGYAAPPEFAAAIRQYDAFVDLLRREVAQIEFLDADDRASLDSIYAYDPVLVTEYGTVLCRMGKPMRRSEAEITANYLLGAGIPILGRIEAPGTLEAGDVVWLDGKTVAVGLGYRTNHEGIRQFRDIVGRHDIDVMVVPLPHWNGPGACLHLMSLISLVDSDLAVTYSRALPVFMREWLLARGYTLLDVPDEERRTLACNVLAVSPRRCMMVSGNPTTRGLLAEAGATVIEYEGTDISLKGTGGPTCLTRPLLRQ